MSKDNVRVLIKLIIMAVLLIAGIGFSIWVMVTYGNKPISEVPVWVLWLMRK